MTLASAAPGRAAAAVLMLMVLGLSEGAGLLCLVPLLGLVGVQASEGTLSTIQGAFASGFAHVGITPTLPAILTLYVVIAGAQSLAQRWQTRLNASLNEAFAAGLRDRVYQAIVRAEWAFLVRVRTSECTYVLTQAIERVGSAVYTLMSLFAGVAIASVYFILALRVSLPMTLLVMAAGAALAWFTRRRFGAAQRVGADLSTAATRLYTGISEHLASLKTAKSYAVVDRHIAGFSTLVAEQQTANVRMIVEYASFKQRLSFGLALVLAIVVFVARAIMDVQTAQLLLLLFLFARLMPRITTIYEAAQYTAAALPTFGTIVDFEARCRQAAEPAVRQAAPLPLTRDIRFDQVTFDYGGGAPAAVQQCTIRLEAGKTTAIVGPSGAGKSTMADLLLGLLSPSSGRIQIDGRDLDADHIGAWRAGIGYVPQETFLFHDTVRANLRWARPDATDEDIWHALRLAQAEVFIRRMPAGLDTMLGDRGALVSGGERQRLSLARALLRHPTLLILDEATSALDSENEARIHEAIAHLHHTVTIVVITHRLSTIRDADCIHVMDAGHLVESGTWEDLTRRGGRFRELLEAQRLAGGRPVVVDEGLAAASRQAAVPVR